MKYVVHISTGRSEYYLLAPNIFTKQRLFILRHARPLFVVIFYG